MLVGFGSKLAEYQHILGRIKSMADYAWLNGCGSLEEARLLIDFKLPNIVRSRRWRLDIVSRRLGNVPD